MKTRLPSGWLAAAILVIFSPFAQAEEPPPPFTAAAATAQVMSGWNVEFRHWEQGNPDLKLIRKDEGFCALTGITGHFQGSGEQVQVYVGDDGYWHLGGTSHQEGVAADCVVVRFPSSPAVLSPAPLAPAKIASVEPVKILAASYSFGSQYADVTGRVRTLLASGNTVYANPDCLLVDPQPGWNKALVIFCEVRGKPAILSVGEGESVSKESILKDARPVAAQEKEF